MTDLISYPFRLAANGKVVTRPDDEPGYFQEELAGLVQTEPGERALVPDYGLTDPAFSDFPEDELKAKVELFGPPVDITNIKANFPIDGIMEITVEFEESEIGLNDTVASEEEDEMDETDDLLDDLPDDDDE